MNEMTETRTTAIIGAEIRALSVQCNTMRVQYAIEIGRRLCEAKDLCKHGEWLDFLKRETAYSQPKASRLMQIYREYAAEQIGIEGAESKYSTLNNLSISNALALLDLPEEERESFALEHDAEHMSARDLEAAVKMRTAELEAEKQSLADAVENLTFDRDTLKESLDGFEEKLDLSEKEREEMEKTLARMRDELREIESRPQPVAVVRDDKAIEEAAAAARAEATKDLEKSVQAARMAAEAKAAKEIKALKEQVSATASSKQLAEKELEKLRGQLKEAETKAADGAAPYKEQIRALEGRLAAASPEVAEFKAAFDRAQKELTAMLDALHKVQDGDLRAKLSGAARAVLGRFTAEVEG